MGFLDLKKDKKDPRFLHLLDLKNMRVIFSKDAKGVRVEVCETKNEPPYVATLKFSFYATDNEYKKITTKHKRILNKMMGELEALSSSIEELYRKKNKHGESEKN